MTPEAFAGAAGFLAGGAALPAVAEAFLAAAGFEGIDLEPTRIYKAEDAKAFLADAGLDTPGMAESIDGRFMSAFVRATKPAVKAACCAPGCCP